MKAARRRSAGPDRSPHVVASRAELQALLDEARDAQRAGRAEEAVAQLEQVIASAGPADLDLMLRAHERLTTVHTNLNDYAKGLEAALEWLHASGESTGSRVRALCDVALALCRVGELDRSLETSYRALAQAEAEGNGELTAKALNSVGWVMYVLGRTEEACEVMERTLALSRDLPDGLAFAPTGNLCVFCGRAGAEAALRGDLERSQRYFARSLELNDAMLKMARERSNEELVHGALGARASMLVRMGDPASVAQAGKILDEVLDYTRRVGSRVMEGIMLITRGNVQLLQDQPQAAWRSCEDALAILREFKDWSNAQNCLSTLASIAESCGDQRAALRYWRMRSDLSDQTAVEAAHLRARSMEVMHKTETARMHAEAERLRAQLLEVDNRKLKRRTSRLTHEATTDGLTGVRNRRHLDLEVEHWLSAGAPFCVALIDIDHFKRINDLYSHQTGDAVLRGLGKLLRQRVRRSAVAARYGGEEFALLLPDCSLEEGRAVAERLRLDIEEHDWRAVHPELRVTVSIGIANTAELAPGAAAVDIFSRVDARLYAAKRSGRNRVTATEADPPALSG